MRKFKITLFICLPFLLDVVISCCNCKKATILNYSNSSASVFNLDYTSGIAATNSSSPITSTLYGIRFEQNRTLLACNYSPIPAFTSSAYARTCKCDPAIKYNPLDTIIDFRIFTVNDFDSLHASNSEVTKFFKVFEGKNNPKSEIDYFIKTYSKLYSEFIGSNFIMDLCLVKPAKVPFKHQFKIQVKYSDGRNLELKTDLVDLI